MENSLYHQVYNPDVLTCIANLSNDEVFTPPGIANKMLDLLPQELFENPDTTFLDPACKSGVFLREIAKRLIKGLEPQIPNLEKRIDHIFRNQLFGISITELTSLLSRRSVYCSKFPSSEYSVCQFPESQPQGNIVFQKIKHTWENGKCRYCGASQSEYDRAEDLENHAYQFIHNIDVEKLFNMKFDVIIGNPPYQLSDGSGGSTDSANPIYQLFIDTARKLSPRYLCMIIPSKWMVGGKAVLSSFREEIIYEKHIKYMCDFEDANDCFAGVHIDGGVCFFLWDRDYTGKTKYVYKMKDGDVIESYRYLFSSYSEYVIRDVRILSILEAIKGDAKFSEIVSKTKPYGIRKFLFNEPERYPDAKLSYTPFPGSIEIRGVKGLKGGAKRQIGYIDPCVITNNRDLQKYKIFFTTSYSTGAIQPPEPILADKNVACTETFLQIGPFETKTERDNCYSYMQTRFFKFLLYYGKGTMQVNQKVFSLIPIQDFSKPWTDEELYAKYNLTEDEIAFIESMIRPME